MQPRSKLPERRKKRDFTRLSELLRPKTTLDWVLLIFGTIAIIFAGWIGYDQSMAPLAVQNNAANFATKLRDVQALARDSGSVVRLDVYPARPNHPCYYVVTLRRVPIRTEAMTDGVSAVGTVIFDEQGVPTARTKITFRKGFVHESVVIDRNGKVSMPE